MIAAARWLWPPGAPSWRALPEAIMRAVMFGLVAALPLSFVFSPPSTWRFFWLDPTGWFLQAITFGVILSVSFYVACGLPVSYLLQSRTASARPSFVIAVAIVGAAFGTITSLALFRLSRGAVTPGLTRLVVVAAVLAVILTLTLTAWYRLQADKAVADARARNWALQAQINPHFFFNTLNTIAAQIRPNPDAAERMLGLLADMSRYSLSTDESHVVPLRDELDFALAYLEIERERFGQRLSWVLPDAHVVEGLSLPALTLQPLVENAVRHGVARRVEGGTIAIRVERSATEFTLTVTNPIDEMPDRNDLFRPGHALWNTRERLRLTYGKQITLDMVTCEPNTLTARIHARVAS
ncbi:MAG: hypothetical protein EHM55_09220 [Acidobacteria bacterium]|nr:MAG: hypothetical protein EHM55_09220 [Acidobacteriota bacterium]